MKLSTPARWDRFLKGDQSAVTMPEMRGWMTFHHAGCTTCHNGSTIGGQSLQKLGAKLLRLQGERNSILSLSISPGVRCMAS
jgi:cytochrome c peroxidase